MMSNENTHAGRAAMRRPRSSRGLRAVVVRTRVTSEEMSWLSQRAAHFSLSLSAYTRLVMLSRKLPAAPLTRESLDLLKGVGNELGEAVGVLRWSCGRGNVEDEDLEFFEERCGKLYALLRELTAKLEAG
jgi:hypothetical protein